MCSILGPDHPATQASMTLLALTKSNSIGTADAKSTIVVFEKQLFFQAIVHNSFSGLSSKKVLPSHYSRSILVIFVCSSIGLGVG